MRQILANLLDNALKYTPSGGQVRISARKENGRVLLEVADTGIGIPTADLDRIPPESIESRWTPGAGSSGWS